jgi:hypothetical protein
MINLQSIEPSNGLSGAADGRKRNRPVRWDFRALAGAIVAAAALASCGADGDPLARTSDPVQSELSEADHVDPAEVVRDYRTAFNDRDLERLMSLFDVDSVVTDHPFATRSEGLAAIRSLQLRDIVASADADAYQMSNIEVAGDTVTWNHEYTNADGFHWCADGNSATVADGKILNWTFAPNPRRCER